MALLNHLREHGVSVTSAEHQLQLVLQTLAVFESDYRMLHREFTSTQARQN